MKKSRNIILSVLLTVCAFCLCFALAGCGKKDDKNEAKYGYGEEGFYYYDGADSSRYMLSLQSGTYMITVNGASAYSGSYSYDEESGKVSFSGDGEFAATLGESSLSLDVEGSGYSFKAFKYFDVTYVDETGKVIATESVLNGQSAEGLDIEKEGYWFIGWYEDSTNSAEFAFNTSIAGNTTIYGWYIEINPQATEFEITLDYGQGSTDVVSTQNGALWTLPSSFGGNDIIGWWASATNKSGELTYKYDIGTEFVSDTTLFAVYTGIGASVTSAGVTWENAGGANVSVTVYNESGDTVVSGTVSATTGIFTSSDFTSLGTGTYTVVVTSGSTDTLTYVVNGLPRVSLSFSDIIVNGSGRVISFAPVDGAEGYRITVTNGERTVTEDLGSHTYYNFSDWEMTAEGITFVVTAYADGYADSVSDGFTYLLVLGNVTIDISDDVVSWNWVEGALEYVVTITDADGNVIDSFRTSDTSFSLKYYENGTYDITVQPHTDGYYSEAKTYYGYAKDSLKAPQITDITNYTVSWEPVDGADSYVVMINGVEYNVADGTSLAFSEYNVPENADSYEIAVKAVAEDGNDSSYSDAVIAANGGFSSSVRYEKNTIYWDYDVAASGYVVSVNGVGTEVSGGNSAEITLNKAGDNIITVTAYDGEDVLWQAETTVYAYSITLDPNGAELEGASVIYVAQGDVLNLGEVTKDHAVFVSWYTQADYTDGQSDVYEGRGSEVANGSVFTGARDMYLYAYWTYEYVTVTLVTGSDGTLVGVTGNTYEVKYNSTTFTLPVAEPVNIEDAFIGWFTEENGEGTQYAEDDGKYVGIVFTEDTTLYAYYLPILNYTKTTYAGETVYSVTANSRVNLNKVTSVTVREYTDEGKSYGLILNSGAFENCVSLVTINIPDTVRFISVINDGYRSGTGAFAGCMALKEVNVYATGESADASKEVTYFSEDGVLFKKIDEAGGAELIYYPYGRDYTSLYAIPSVVRNEYEIDAGGNAVTHDVVRIASMVFRNRQIGEIVVPTTVTYVSTQAFYDNAYITAVTFEAGGTSPLTIADRAFQKCTSLTSVTFPARYTDFDAEVLSACSAVTNVEFEAGSGYTTENGILLADGGATIAYFPTGLGGDIDISSLTSGTITKIGDYAFYANTKITSVYIPASVTHIGEGAFYECTALKSVSFGVEEGENRAGYGDLTIEDGAFCDCAEITSVYLPCNLTSLGVSVFQGCSRLTYVYFDARPGTKTSDLKFTKYAFGSSNVVTTIEFGENVPEIDDFATIFGGSNLEKVIIAEGNDNYQSDEAGAVYNKAGTQILYYPSGRIGEYTLLDSTEKIVEAFYGNVNLTKITIGRNVSYIEEGAFDGCTYLTAIVVDENNQSFASIDGVLYAKENGDITELVYCPMANAVTVLEIPETVTKVAEHAFHNNSTVTQVTFKATTSFELGAYAFYNATKLVTVILPDCTTEIPDYAFYTCTSLLGDLSTGGTMTLPEGITTIGQYAFYQDKSFACTIPASVENIGARAFYQCWDNPTSKAPITFASVETAAEEVSLSENGAEEEETSKTLEIGTYAFYQAQYATALTIPKNTTSVGTYAFYQVGYQVSAGIELKFEEGCEITELSDYVFYQARYATEFVIPETVTKIDQYALDGMNGLTEITIPASVKSIGDYALASMTGLTTVTFADNSALTTIGVRAFNSSNKLTSLTIPASVTSIGNGMCMSCSKLETVVFADGCQLTEIPYQAFSGCTVLSSISLPSTITKIDYSAFSSCKALTTITIPESVTEIGYSAFSFCTELTSISIPASVKTIGYTAFNWCNKLATITFESGSCLEEIGDSAFIGCDSLTSFSFPESTAQGGIELGKNLFEAYVIEEVEDEDIERGEYVGHRYYAHLESLYISASVVNLGSALNGVEYLNSISVAETSTSYTTGDSNGKTLYSYDKKTIVFVCDEVETLTIESTVEALGNYVFANQEKLTTVTIPATVTSIGDYAFYNCTALTSVNFETGSGLTDEGFGEYVFSGCTSLSSVTLPDTDKVTRIPANTFEYCESLEAVSIPTKIVSIGDYAFQHSGLESIDLGSISTIGEYAFESCADLSEVKNITELTTLGSYAFESCTSLKTIALPNSISEIPGYCFNKCSSLESFDVPQSVISIGAYCFANCTSLASVTLPEKVSELGNYAFYVCSSLTEINLPASLVSFGQHCFDQTKITSISVPEGCEKISDYFCYKCYDLEYVYIPDSVTTINTYAFASCTSLKSVYTGAGVTAIQSYAFDGCSALEEVMLGSNVASIGNYAFRNCTSLVEIEIGATVSSLGTYVFDGDSNLKSVTMEKGLESIGQYAFRNCTSLTYVIMPSTVASMGSSIFSGCTCTVYLERTPNYMESYWGTSWASGLNGWVYFYSDVEPGFAEDGTSYDEDYWHYDENGEIVIWTFGYTTYAVEGGGYVLWSAADDAISYVGIRDAESGTVTAFAVATCSGNASGYAVTLSNGDSYIIVLTSAEGTLTAILTATGD